jgi:uncharacterized protein YutD
MRVRRHFRTSQATIDYIIADFSLNKISNKDTYFMICVNDRINKLNEEYQSKIDKMLDLIIKHCSFADYPVDIIANIMYSLSKVTNALSKGILSLL